jgi:uncharacterized protein YcfJ
MNITDLIPSFTDELEKLAQVGESKKEKGPDVRGALAGAVAPGLAATAFGATALPFANDLSKSTSQTQNLASKVRAGMGAPKDTTFVDMGHHPANNAYNPITKQVMHSTGSREAILAHELGHAKNYAGKLRNPLIGGRLASRLVGGGGTAALTGAIAGGQEDPSWTPGMVNLGLNAPVLADEAMATGRALKYMTKQHGVLKGLGRSAALAPAFGSYAAIAGTPLAITAYRKHKAKQKTAMIGALLGGAAGYMMPGGSLKSKAINTAVGAGVGHLAGKAVGAAKRSVWDDPRARAHNDLYGYQPQDPENFR